MASCTDAVSQVCSSIAFLLRKAMRFFVAFMKEIVVTMLVQSPLWLKLFVMGFIG